MELIDFAYTLPKAGVGMNWDFIDFWIEELYPEKFNTWHEMDWEEQEEYEERGMQE